MENRKNDNTFSYKYSARQQEEVKNIRKKYMTDEQDTEDKMEKLRRLDHSATEKANLWSLVLGILSALVLGVGMCCCFVWDTSILVMIVGIIIGLIGIVGMSLAYPFYSYILERERKKIAPEIIRLSDELLK